MDIDVVFEVDAVFEIDRRDIGGRHILKELDVILVDFVRGEGFAQTFGGFDKAFHRELDVDLAVFPALARDS